jgi:hypothetical protein
MGFEGRFVRSIQVARTREEYDSFSYSPTTLCCEKGEQVADRIIKVCDECGVDMPSGTGAEVRIAFFNKGRGVMKADLCDQCAGKIPARPARARQSRRRSQQVAATTDA